MTISLHEITLKDLFDDYANSDEEGVVGYHGRLNIRPKYQREFVYNDKEQLAVVDTVLHGFPLNTMYWVVARDEKTQQPIMSEDGKPIYELLDGQQRTISICEFLNNKFSMNFQTFFNIMRAEPDIADQILKYKLQVYICDGAVSEKLDWFRTINIAGEKLTEQELLNAQYTGEWLTAAKRYFSKTNCTAGELMVIRDHNGSDYMKGSSIRQEYLSTVLQWIADFQELKGRSSEGDTYMSEHQGDDTASELKNYYVSVMEWVGSKFKEYRKEEKGLPWGIWYNSYQRGGSKQQIINSDKDVIEEKIDELLADDEVTSVKGIYEYIVDGEEKHLALRQFDRKIAMKRFEEQNHHCPYCEESKGGHTYPAGTDQYAFSDMEADHIVPWSQGGKTIYDNCQMLCKWHNGHKSDN